MKIVKNKSSFFEAVLCIAQVMCVVMVLDDVDHDEDW